MPKSIKGKYVMHVTVIDPDTQNPIDVEIYKLDTGGMVGIDSSFLDTCLPIFCPFDKNIELDLED